MNSKPIDHLFTNAIVITMNPDRDILSDASVVVDQGKIIWIGNTTDLKDQFSPKHVIQMNGKVLIPGLINAHGHWAMTLFRGLVDDCTLDNWLAKIWQVEAEFIASSPENVVVGSQLAMLEMLQFGTTCAADMYWYYQDTTEAAIDAGFRIINGPSFADISGFEDYRNTTREIANEYLDYYRNEPLVHLCIQAHSAYMTNPQILEEVLQIQQEHNLIFITHAAESAWELDLVREKYGKSPIEVFDSLNLLGDHTLLAHCVHLTDEEITRLAETKTSVVHCPSANLKLSSGIARVADMLKAGVNVTFGTDGPASNNDLNLIQEAHLAAMVQKGITGDPIVLPAEKVFSMMTIDAARAFQLNECLGSIEVGKLADLVVIDMSSVNLTPCYDLYSHIIYALSGADISDVMVNGKMLIENRQFRTLDAEALKFNVIDIAKEISGIKN